MPDEITELLASAVSGRRDAWDRLADLLYDDLRKIADSAMRRERAGHTLQPTALVHEAFMQLAGQKQANWNNRVHFYGAAANAMRRVLVQYSRQRAAIKRGGGLDQTPLNDLVVAFEERSTDLAALDDALRRLEELDAQQCRIVELRFFGGLTVEETAKVMDMSPSSVERGWRVARAWLLGELRQDVS